MKALAVYSKTHIVRVCQGKRAFVVGCENKFKMPLEKDLKPFCHILMQRDSMNRQLPWIKAAMPKLINKYI